MPVLVLSLTSPTEVVAVMPVVGLRVRVFTLLLPTGADDIVALPPTAATFTFPLCVLMLTSCVAAVMVVALPLLMFTLPAVAVVCMFPVVAVFVIDSVAVSIMLWSVVTT